MPPPLPTFDNLTLDPKGPPGNAWGLFGPNNDLGMLNHLTPPVVKKAATEEIRDGVRISLDLPLDRLSHPSFGRKPLHQELYNKAPRIVNDDVLTFNTQSGTQWDGFRHYGNQTHGCYFNGHSLDELKETRAIGIDAWSNSGGITGRGILIDYASHAKRNNIPLTPFKTSTIPLSTLQQILSETNLAPRTGDILFIRTGFTEAFNALSPSEEAALAARPTPDFAGVENGEKTLRWLWENQFAAIASDAPSFEPAPLVRMHEGVTHEDTLHQWCLSNWGLPIGEYFDLEEVAACCRERGRWSFFLSSVPLKVFSLILENLEADADDMQVPGGVASPPNAVAIL